MNTTKEAPRRKSSDAGGLILKSSRNDPTMPPGCILVFEATITTNEKDRDDDILETKGARPDPEMPFLLHHDPSLVVGKLLKITEHSESVLKGRFCILDTELGRDAAVLIEAKALRISHGFDPIRYTELKGGRYRISEFSIYETSGVGIPANPGARIDSVSRAKLKTAFCKSLVAQMDPPSLDRLEAEAREADANAFIKNLEYEVVLDNEIESMLTEALFDE